jgi:hypothetical protein
MKLDPKWLKAALNAEDICRDAGRKVAMEAAIHAYLSTAQADTDEIERLRKDRDYWHMRYVEVCRNGVAIADAIRAYKAQHVVSSAPQSTMEGRPMGDLADFADDLETLVRDALEAGVDREEIKRTLTAKRQELDDEEEGNEDDGEAAP